MGMGDAGSGAAEAGGASKQPEGCGNYAARRSLGQQQLVAWQALKWGCVFKQPRNSAAVAVGGTRLGVCRSFRQGCMRGRDILDVFCLGQPRRRPPSRKTLGEKTCAREPGNHMVDKGGSSSPRAPM